MALAAVLGLWLLASRRRIERVVVAVGASMAAGAIGSLAFTFGVAGVTELSNQTELRTVGGGFTVREFVASQWHWFRDLLPPWYLVLLPVGVVAGLIDRRTRFYTLVAGVYATGWVVGLPNGSYVHDYWPYPVLIVGVVGMAALLDAVWSRLPRRVGIVGGALVGLALVAAFVGMVRGSTAEKYFTRPHDAGRLLSEHGPAPGQQQGWQVSFQVARFLSYYWDIPPVEASPGNVSQARPGDLVFMRLDRIPEWLSPSVGTHAVAREGRYVLVRMADVRAAVKRRPLAREPARGRPPHGAN
jgi:hypothetical protein